MKTFFTRLFRGLSLLFSVIAICALAGCGETDVFVGGRVLDADTEAPLDSAHVSLYYIDKREARLNLAEYSDSLGHFFLYDFGRFGNNEFFILASKPGYVSQSLDVGTFDTDLEIRLDPE